VVEQNLKNKKALELANKSGSDAAISLKTASQLSSKFSAAGTKSDLKSMASSFKLKVEDVPEFVPIDARGGDTMVRMLSPLVSTLQPGELGGYQPGPEFGFIAFLKDCGAVDEKKFGEYLPNLVTQRESQRKNEILEEWRNQRLASKGTKLPPDMVAKK
jgi:hypothetical protein